MAHRTKANTKRSPMFWDKVLIYVFGIFLSLALISSIYVKYGEYSFGSLIFTGIFWAMIEIITPASNHWSQALIRFIPAFIVGTVFGAVFTYFTQFGYYVIEPAIAGSIIAWFALSGVVIFTLVTIWAAVWSHNRAYIRR